MVFRFGRFELDENRRELRLDGRAREMQPRVFDLLVYLVRNQDRVVPKEELLAAIWPDVMVTDSSIMRIVSLIRTSLLAGGERDAIRTFSRQGYRFVAELEAAPGGPSGDRSLDRAREACARGDWPEAIQQFRKVAAATRLQAPDFEQWGHAALYIGQPNEAIYPLERAVAAHIQNADRLGAARAALTLANVNLEGRALPVAKGWHRRAGVFLAEETGEAPEHGLHLWLEARIALLERDLPRTLEFAQQAEALARRVQDPDVEVLGLVYRGHIELATGDIRRGLVHLDEAGAATLAGTVSPWVSGIVFCSVIWAYLDRGDINRAGQWTEQFTRWVKQNAAFGAPGLCRLHRGEVMCLLGDLQKAESEIVQARELLAESARYAEGDACRVLGEIRLLRGDVDGAESAFRQAHELGWHPLPGWALLQAEKGRFAAAVKALQRGLAEPSWADGQRRGILLAQLARCAARAGQLPLARRSLAELENASGLRSTAGCEAACQQGRAEIALAEGQPERAIKALRKALAVWLEAGSRINVAHVRLRLAEVLLGCGDHDEADLEITSAEKAFVRMGAEPMVARCRAARRKAQAGARRAARN